MLTAERVITQQSQNAPLKGSESFRLEYGVYTPEQTLWNDIVSYLGEYRFQIENYHYNLAYTKGTDGNLRLRNEENGEPMVEVAKRAIVDRQQRGEPVSKLVADVLGAQKMEEGLSTAKDGDTLLYASPADPEVGYTYGFLYAGRVHETENGEKKLSMQAIRLDQNADPEHFNTVFELLAGRNPGYSHPNEFIADPIFISKGIEDMDINFVLKGIFNFKVDSSKQQGFVDVIAHMRPVIQEFITLVRQGADNATIQKAFYSLENYAIEMKKTWMGEGRTATLRREVVQATPQAIGLAQLMQTHSYEPPKAVGSCGSTGGRSSADIYGSGSIFGSIKKDFSSTGEDQFGSREFECPSCGKKNIRPEGKLLPRCQHCGSKEVSCET